MSIPTKETILPAPPTADPSGSPTGASAKPGATSGRSDAVCKEIPVRAYASRLTSLYTGATGHTEPLDEETTTLILFPQGAVVRLLGGVTPGERLVLVNRKTQKDVICRVLNVKPNPNGPGGYVEVEFTQPITRFWGIDFPAGALSAPPSPAPALTRTEQKTTEQKKKIEPPADSPASAPAAPNPSRVSAPVAAASTSDVRKESAPPKERIRPSKPARAYESIAPKPGEEVLDFSSPPRRASGATGAILPLAASVSPAHSQGFSGRNERSTIPRRASFSSLEALGMEPVSQVKGGQQPQRTLILACAAAAVLVLAMAAGKIVLSHLRASEAATVTNSPPAVAEVSPPATPPNTATLAEIKPEPPPAAALLAPAHPSAGPVAQPSPASRPSTSTTATRATPATASTPAASAKQEVEKPQEVNKPSEPRRFPLTVSVGAPNPRVPMPANASAPAEEPAPPAIGGEIPGGLPGSPSGAMGGILPGVPRSEAAPAPPPVAETQSPAKVGGRVKPPRLLSSVLPIYPAFAKQNHVEGDVTIEADIDKAGNVVRMKVVSGPPLLHQAAMDALRKWKYEPGTLNDQPVTSQTVVTIKFRFH